MCRLCGDKDCGEGELCGLRPYLEERAVADAVARVQAIDPGFVSQGFGPQLYVRGKWGPRPAPVQRVWDHFKAIGSSGYDCPYCRRHLTGWFDVDHRVPWETYIRRKLRLSAGEEIQIPLFVARVLASDPDNLHLVCASCNRSKGDRTEESPDFPQWLAYRRDQVKNGGASRFSAVRRPPSNERERQLEAKLQRMNERKQQQEWERAMRRLQRQQREERYAAWSARRWGE